MQKDAVLDLLLVREDVLSKMELSNSHWCLGHSDHKVIKFKISINRRKKEKGLQNLICEHKESRFQVAQELVSKVSWENVFAGARVQQCWLLFKHHLQTAQEQQFLNVGSQAGGVEGHIS